MRKLIALLLSSVMVVSSVTLSKVGQDSIATASESKPAQDSIATVAVSYPTKDRIATAAVGTSVPEGKAIDMVGPAVEPIAVGEPYPGTTTKENMNQSLEKVIKAVKAKITIPKEYSEFNYYFNGNSYGQETNWNLNWSRPSDSSFIQVNSDQNGNIIYYSKYDYSKIDNSVPVYLEKELKETAEKFIKQIALQIYQNMEFVEADYEGIYNGTYAYTFQRMENGVSFPDNYVIVSVDGVTGEVRNANIAWTYDGKVPSSVVKLTKEEAAQIIKKNVKMNLVYRMNYYRIYDGVTNEYMKKAFLVYEPSQSYISVDAKTGEVYLTRSEWIQRNSGMDTATAEEAAKMDDGSTGLTEEEIEKINELEKLISKEQAIEAVTDNRSLYIDKNLITYQATLNKNYGTRGKDTSYVWYISLSDSRPVDYEKDEDTYRAYASATVDAKTGKILSFNANLKSNYDSRTGKWNSVKINYDKKEAQSILEKFLKAQIKDRFNHSKLVNSSDGYIAYYKEENTPVYGGYSFQYNCFNEGIEFAYNGIYGEVDGVTGKIYSYHCNWDEEIEFESPKGAMTPEEAFTKYIGKEGYHLVYEVNEINEYDPNYLGKDRYYDSSEAYSLTKEIRLVYRPDVNPSYISPFTGEQLNYDGSVYEEKKPIVYTDIADTKENREILILADMNIGFEGDKFLPDKDITAGELKVLLDQIGYGYWYDDKETKAEDNSLITREKIAFDFINRLGLTKLASLQGIYSTDYYDETNIKSEYLGAIALAKGLGLMEAAADNYFYPKDNVTRADAVHLIMNFIAVQRKGIY